MRVIVKVLVAYSSHGVEIPKGMILHGVEFDNPNHQLLLREGYWELLGYTYPDRLKSGETKCR